MAMLSEIYRSVEACVEDFQEEDYEVLMLTGGKAEGYRVLEVDFVRIQLYVEYLPLSLADRVSILVDLSVYSQALEKLLVVLMVYTLRRVRKLTFRREECSSSC
jgi:hypothetical protein